MDIAQGSIGDAGAWEIDLVDGKIVIAVKAQAAGGALAADIKLTGDAIGFAKAYAAKTANKVDDAVVGIVEAAVQGK